MTVQANYNSPFVGREEQLQTLLERFQVAEGGEGSVVILAGEAGVGKTRLTAELCDILAKKNVPCSNGQCLEYIQLPFAPFVATLGKLVQNQPQVLASAPHIRAALAHLVPELESVDGTRLPAEASNKLRQFNLMAEAVQLFGKDRPAVIVIEDLQWGDSATWEFLLHLIPYIAASHVLLLITYRSDALSRDHPLRSTLAKLERSPIVSRIILEPLERAHMFSLVFRSGKTGALPANIVNAICARAEGNPLFAEELLKAVIETGEVSARRLPHTLQEAVRDRLRTINEEERIALTCAAAIGRRFQADFLAHISAQPIGQVLSALRHALDLQLVAEETNGAIYYRFRHELTRQAIYGELLAAEAQLLHHKIASTLEATKSEDQPGELAYHWWQAHEYEKAARYQERAGDAAFAVFAYSDALINYERALASCSEADGHQAALTEKISKTLHQCGLGERAKEAGLSAVALYEAAGESKSAARVCLNIAQLCFDLGQTADVRNFAERALRLIEGDVNDSLFYIAHVELMALHVNRWNADKSREHMLQAQRFIGTPPPAARVRFLQMKTALDACSGNVRQALTETKDAAALAEQNQDFRSALRSWHNFSAGMASIGEFTLAAQGFAECRKIIQQHNIGGMSLNWFLEKLADARLHQGELQEAAELVEQVLVAGVEMPAFQMLVARTGLLAGLWLERDDLAERCANPELVEHALNSDDPTSIGALSSFVEYYVARNRTVEAHALLERALEKLETTKSHIGPGDVDKLLVALARYGPPESIFRGRAILAAIEKTSKVRSTPACLALVDAYAAARGSNAEGGPNNEGGPDAKAAAQQAARLFHGMQWFHYEAQALELAGQAQAALEIYRHVNDLRDLHRLEAPLPVNRQGRNKQQLTPRERQIHDLILAGKTNKAIAEELTLSERTVENHVSSILGKIGVSSRAELMAKSYGHAPAKVSARDR